MDVTPPPAIIEILRDQGGSLGERMVIQRWLARIGAEVRIKGTCASACAFLLGLPRNQVCVYPAAWLGYHTKDEAVEWERGRALIARGTRECR